MNATTIMDDKKKKLTAKERKALKKLELIEKKKQLKRDHLQREIKYDRLTIGRYEKDWRKMLSEITLTRMKQELEFAWHQFERTIDSKNFTISLLMDEIRDSNEQYMLNFKQHSENIASLLQMFYDRLQQLTVDNQNIVNTIMEDYQSEINEAMTGSNQNSEYIKTMLYGLEMAAKDYERMVHAEYFAKIDEETIKDQMQIHKLNVSLEMKFQKRYVDLQDFIKDFNKARRDRIRDYDLLHEQDDNLQALIQDQLERIDRSYERIKQLRQQLSDVRDVEGQKLKELEQEYDFLHTTFASLKCKLKTDLTVDKHKLIELNRHFTTYYGFLERIKYKGANALKLIVVCRKNKTQKEKTLPFPWDGGLKETSKKTMIRRGVAGDKLEMEKNYDDKMFLFWQQVGLAGSNKRVLEERRASLRRENYSFVSYLKSKQ